MEILTVLEILVIFFNRNIIFKKSIFNNFLISIITTMSIFIVNEFIIELKGSVPFIVIVVVLSAIIKYKEDIDWYKAIIQVTISLILMLLSECVAYIVCLLINEIVGMPDLLIVVIVVAFWAITMYITWKLPIKIINDLNKTIENNYTALIILFNIILVFITAKLLADSDVLTGTIGVQLLILVILFFILTSAIYSSFIKQEKEKDRLKVENSFKPILEEYIQRLRASEHEYRNHLNAIYGMLKVGTHEEINSLVESYINNIKNHEGLNKLIYVDNTILKAVLYSKLIEAEDLGLTIRFNIKSNLSKIPLGSTDLVIVLSNLLNNAIEAAKKSKEKYIDINIKEENQEEKTKYLIEVENSLDNPREVDINSLIKIGYTTKGNGRGYGLANINSILKTVNGMLLIELKNRSISMKVEVEVNN